MSAKTAAQIRADGARIAVAYYQDYGEPGSWLRYGQVRPMPTGLRTVEALRGGRIDCSAFATLVFKEAGAPDPNGRGYDGYGYTGTLIANGDKLPAGARPQALDLAFYGDPYATSGHVAVVINDREVISFGHTPIRRYPIAYRSDYRGVWRYDIPDPQPVERWFLELAPFPNGGQGPRVMGPWVDERAKWQSVHTLAGKMRDNGRNVAVRTRGKLAWIVEYLPGTHGDRLRYGPWPSRDYAEAARTILEGRHGPMRLYKGDANTVYKFLP